MIAQNQIQLLDGSSLTLKQLDSILKEGKSIDLTQNAWKMVVKSRQAINQMMADPKKVVYGITTGFGSFASVSISPQDRKLLQNNLICSHAVGVGKPVSLQIVKRMLILRINTLAKGRSGISPQNLRKLIKAFNCGFLPLVPQQGTVGASGDLAPLAHLALGLLGQGDAWDSLTQTFVPALPILQRMNLQPLKLHEKQGLALINGTQFLNSFLSQAIPKAQAILYSSVVLYTSAVEIFGVQRQMFMEQSCQYFAQYNSELGEIINHIGKLLGKEESALHKQRRWPQQSNSLLDCPQAMAGVLRTIRYCQKICEAQMNAATDNPLVYFKEDGFQQDQLIAAGNFHGQYVAKAADFLGVALFEIGKFSQARIQKLIDAKVSRLPPFLIKNGGLNSGFMISQYTTASLLSESKVLVKPASVDSIITSAGQQDHVSMGGFAVRKCMQLVQNMSNICAIELLMVVTALQQLALQTSQHLTHIVKKLRHHIQPLLEDRYYGKEIKTAQQLIFSNLTKI